MAGRVRVGSGDSGRTNRKPGDLLASDAPVAVIESDPYVSRGGHKLEAALDAFGVSPADRVCLDVGASTGGFTDVLLQRGARHVYAVDVGRGQLAERLRLDPRVTSLERTNARTLTPDVLGERVSLAVVDVSFISLSLVLGPTAATFEDGGGDVSPWSSRSSKRVAVGRTAGSCATRRCIATCSRAWHATPRISAFSCAVPSRRRCSGPQVIASFCSISRYRRDRRTDQRRRSTMPGWRGSTSWRPMTQRIGLAYNPTMDAALELRERAAGWLHLRGVDHWVAQADDYDTLVRELSTTEALIVLGGDGTFLRAARATAAVDVPLLGVNLGKVGFLSKIEAVQLEAMLGQLVAHQYSIDERMAARATIYPGGSDTAGETFIALNDVVVARGMLARVVRLDVAIGESHLATFVADGLVVSTPTGSTGYSFSAGGPIVDPVARNLIVTPIAGYLSAIRSVVVSPQQVVRCRVIDATEALISIDGREDRPLAVGDVVAVEALDRPIRLIEPRGSVPFWDLLRHKVELLPS